MIAVYWVLIVGGNPVIYIWDAIETPEVDMKDPFWEDCFWEGI